MTVEIDRPEAAVIELQRACRLVPDQVDYGAQLGWFFALTLIPIGQVVAIEFTMPIWTAILAAGSRRTVLTAGMSHSDVYRLQRALNAAMAPRLSWRARLAARTALPPA